MGFNYNILSRHLDSDLPSFLSLKGIKKHLRIDSEKDDDLLSKIAIAACERAEIFIKIDILERAIKQVIYDFTDSKLTLYKKPVVKVHRIIDDNGNTMSSDAWHFDDEGGIVIFDNELHLPSITVEYGSGFTQNNVSQAIKYGLLDHIAHIYDGKATVQEFPASSVDLYLSFRKHRIWR